MELYLYFTTSAQEEDTNNRAKRDQEKTNMATTMQ